MPVKHYSQRKRLHEVKIMDIFFIQNDSNISVDTSAYLWAFSIQILVSKSYICVPSHLIS